MSVFGVHNAILIPSLHFKVKQKDILRWQVLLAYDEDGYLMIAVRWFQFQNKTWSNFSEWRLLMDQSCPPYKVRRIFQQFLLAVCSIIQLFNITGVYASSFPPAVIIHFHQLLLCSTAFTDHWSLFQSLDRALVMMLQC